MSRTVRTESVKLMLQTDEVKNRLFEAMEQIPFPNETIQHLYPDLVETWTAIGASRNVPWQWVMVMELSLGTFLSPTAVLMPTTTMKIFPVLWNFLIHPGSTQTSNLMAVYRDAFDLIKAAVNSERTRARLEWKPQYPRAAEARNPFSGEVNMSGGSGSLEGEGWFFRHTSDSHCEQQESNYLLDSTKAKVHGKEKTKFLRNALAMLRPRIWAVLAASCLKKRLIM